MTYDVNGNVYAATNGGDIYKQALGAGDFLPTNQTSRVWGAMASNTVTGNIYAGVTAPGDIYIYNNTSGTADLSGGDLVLASGAGKGAGDNNIIFKTARVLGTGTTLQTLTEALRIKNNGNIVIPDPSVPYSAAANGSTGEISWDASNFYVCVSPNTWLRTTLTTW
jgi:hypothetical protein